MTATIGPITRRIRLWRTGGGSVAELAATLMTMLRDPEPARDPLEALEDTDEDTGEGTWREVRSARAAGLLTDAEYDLLQDALDRLGAA